MATCLRCDNCNAIAAENDNELPRWWTVERYGSEWVDEPGREKRHSGAPIMIHSTIMGEIIEMDLDDSEMVEEAMMDDYIEDSQGIAVGLVLHFCKAACLAEWGVQASAFED